MSGLKGMSKAQIQEAGRLADEQRLRYQQLQREQPVDSLGDRINAITQNMKDYWSEGTDYGKLLKAYGDVMAPINESLLKGMKMPYKENKEAIQKRERANLPEMRPAGQLTPFTQSMTDPNYRFIAEIGADPLNLAGAPAVGRLAKKGVQATATSLAPKAGQMAGQLLERQGLGPLNVVKDKGGQFVNVEKNLDTLKMGFTNNKTPEELLATGYTPEQIKRFQIDALVNQYVENNITNYVKKQMATPSDPVRLGIEERIKKAQDILTNKLENNLQARRHKLFDAKAAGADPRDIANLERDLNRYEQQIRQEYKDAVEASSHTMRSQDQLPNFVKTRREAGGYPVEGMGTTPKSKHWENLSDVEVRPTTVESFDKYDFEDNDWLNKLDPESVVYHLPGGSSGQRLGFDHMLDVMRAKLSSGELKPEKLSNLSVDNLVQMTGKYDLEAKKAAERQAEETMRANLLMNPHKEYPSGHKWVELPDPLASPENMKTVQDIGCTGKWCTKDEPNAVTYGGHYLDDSSQRLYTLIDSAGRPHVQISTLHENPKDIQEQFHNLSDEAQKRLIKKYTSRNPNWEYGNRNMSEGDLMREMINEGYKPEASIEQIKPVSNDWDSEMAKNFMEVNPKYREELMPYIQDFVKSRKWTDVNDLGNADMYHVDKPEVIKKYGTPYITQKEFDEATPLIYQTPDMKTGGQVKDCGCHANMDAQRLAVWDKAERRGIGGRMAGKAVSLLTHGGDKALPLSLGRATPKTAQEIDRHATRVARQMLGEHVTSGKPKDTANLAGRSFRESERLKGLDYRVEPTGAARESTAYTPRKGDVNVAIPGDQTISDSILRSVGDIQGIDSVQEGGAKYGLGKMDLEDPLFWASSEVPAQLAQNKINRVAGFYDPQRVVGQHLAMGNVANNFAMHLADANMRAIRQSKVKPKNLNLLDEIIASGYEKKNKKTGQVDSITFPNWPGMDNPEEAMLAMRDDPKLRKWFNDRMKVVDDVTKPLGLPSGLDIQWAVTEPKLRNMEINLTGLSAGEMVPNAKLTDTAAHNTYDKGIRGSALGHQEVLTPFQMSFPDAAEHIASTQRPQDFTGTIQKVFPHQIVDDQWLDEISKYRELIKKYTGQKKGGAVRKGGGGFMAKELAKRLAPKVLPIVEREANLANKALAKTPQKILPSKDFNMDDVYSGVLNKDKTPKKFYHGSMDANIKQLEPNRKEPGIWFTRDFQYANDYAKGPDGKIYSANVSVKNPLVVNFNDDMQPIVNGKPLNIDNNVDIVNYAIKNGYDGVHFPDGNFSEADEAIVAFHPHQTKILEDEVKPDINKAKGGRVKEPVSLDAMRLAVLNKQSKDKRYG
jgi:hypothetical protein